MCNVICLRRLIHEKQDIEYVNNAVTSKQDVILLSLLIFTSSAMAKTDGKTNGIMWGLTNSFARQGTTR